MYFILGFRLLCRSFCRKKTNFRGNRISSWSVSIFKFFGKDLVVPIAIYKTFEQNIFLGSAFKPQNLGDLIALKSNVGKYQFLSLKFLIA